mgnify:CR=1 FL=1
MPKYKLLVYEQDRTLEFKAVCCLLRDSEPSIFFEDLLQKNSLKLRFIGRRIICVCIICADIYCYEERASC